MKEEKISDLLSFEFLTKSVCGGASHKHIDLKAKDMCNIGEISIYLSLPTKNMGDAFPRDFDPAFPL